MAPVDRRSAPLDDRHAADVGLVRDRRRDDLDDQAPVRQAGEEGVGDLVLVGHQAPGGDRESRGLEQRETLGLQQGAPPVGPRAGNQGADPVEIRRS